MQMCVIVKTRCFYSFTINSQSKLKKFSKLCLRHLSRKTRYETRFHGWLFELDGDPKIFHNIFFVENYYMNYEFFQVLQSALLKSETKIFSKMMQVT